MMQESPPCPAGGSTDTRIQVFGLRRSLVTMRTTCGGASCPCMPPITRVSRVGPSGVKGCPHVVLRGTPWTNTDGLPRSTIGEARRGGKRIVEGADLEGRDFTYYFDD